MIYQSWDRDGRKVGYWLQLHMLHLSVFATLFPRSLLYPSYGQMNNGNDWVEEAKNTFDSMKIL